MSLADTIMAMYAVVFALGIVAGLILSIFISEWHGRKRKTK